MLSKVFTELSRIESSLTEILKLPLLELRSAIIDMFKSLGKDPSLRRQDRIYAVFILERLQDVEKGLNPPLGREDYQSMLDNAIRAVEDYSESSTNVTITETFSGKIRLETSLKERFARVANAVPQEDLQKKVTLVPGRPISEHGGILPTTVPDKKPSISIFR